MITAYFRPKTLDEALTLLTQPDTVPLGGGTLLSQPQADPIQAVDLQLLSLDSVKKNGNDLEIGATATLQSLLESTDCPEALKQALKLEAPLNIRNAATAAGTLVACDGRSTFVCILLAADAKIEQAFLENSTIGYRTSNIGEFLPFRPHGLITKITLPLSVKLAFETVARTPSDKPIVCVAVAGWGSGRMRMAVGGYGKSPMLAMDGTSSDDLAAAATNAFHESADEWGSAEYRMDIAATLAKRCADSIK
ncbi:MAG TPA: FAD binding domain-containing protein [Anaerolineales bacterium]|nr:FAD binding domain-containing protein [Anaerolineales bacterium]